MTTRLNFLIVCGCLFFGARLLAAETNSISNSASPAEVAAQNVANGYLQIQAQLHDAELAIEDSRRAATNEARQTAGILTARIQALEETIAAQRANEIEAARKDRQFTLLLAGAFGLLVLAAVLLMAYLQWRAVTRLVELSVSRQPEFPIGQGRVVPSLVTSATVEQSSARLFGAVDDLQKRILQLEQIGRGALAENNSSANDKFSGSKNGDATSRDREECIANLLSEGQILLDEQQTEKALECFDVALGLDGEHVEALVKKGGALEKLGQTDAAIACYDRAIEANQSATIAYLQKGGLFNRLARYDEALHCYEQALRTQEKKQAA
jgi:tetratricopeptide (TPR) repeat protein